MTNNHSQRMYDVWELICKKFGRVPQVQQPDDIPVVYGRLQKGLKVAATYGDGQQKSENYPPGHLLKLHNVSNGLVSFWFEGLIICVSDDHFDSITYNDIKPDLNKTT